MGDATVLGRVLAPTAVWECSTTATGYTCYTPAWMVIVFWGCVLLYILRLPGHHED